MTTSNNMPMNGRNKPAIASAAPNIKLIPRMAGELIRETLAHIGDSGFSCSTQVPQPQSLPILSQNTTFVVLQKADHPQSYGKQQRDQRSENNSTQHGSDRNQSADCIEDQGRNEQQNKLAPLISNSINPLRV